MYGKSFYIVRAVAVMVIVAVVIVAMLLCKALY